jgi:alpha-glucosidase
MDFLNKAIFAIRSIGVVMVLRTVWNSFQKYRLEKKFSSSIVPAKGQPRRPGELQRAEITKRGAKFVFDEGFSLVIDFLTPQMARLSWLPSPPPTPYAVAESNWPAVPVKLVERGDSWALSSSALEIQVHPCGTLEYIAGGQSLRVETSPQIDGSQWTQYASLPEDAAIYGLGERAARLNLRPGSYSLWNTEVSGSYRLEDDPLYMTAPVYHAHSQDGSYLLFYDNSFDGEISFDEKAMVRFMGGGFHYTFILGQPAKALEQYTQLTGRPPLPPRWALGFHQSRWGYKCEEDIRQVVAGFREHDLPLDVVHLDIDYMQGFRVFTLDKQRYPDLKKLIADLEDQGIKAVAILNPGVKVDPQYDVYRQGLSQDMFCKLPDGKVFTGLVWPGWSVFPDFTKPEARRWWGGYYSRLLDEGVAGIWHDMNEPASMSAFGEATLPRVVRHDMEGRGGDHQEAHNLYGLTMAQAGFEAQRRLRPDRRPWLLTRSAWVGMQRYTWIWTGDVSTRWQSLKMTVSTILNTGLTGIPYSGSDIGGFTGHSDAELFTRWFQMSALVPFFRNHAARTTPRSEPWVYGEPTLSICRRYLHLRRSLILYLYTLAWQVSQIGAPLMRPLFWAEPDNPALWEIDDAFLLGEALLVAPVMDGGVEKREVILPKGLWYDFWGDQIFTSGQTISIDAPLEVLPIFVRAGQVLPLVDGEKTTLHIYALEAGQQPVDSQWYDDAGDGYGSYRLNRFNLSWDAGALKMTWVSEGDYPLPEFIDILLHGIEPKKITLDGKEVWPGTHLVNIKPFNEMLVTPG